jgi:DNA-binding CsgD family transcriptional regulator
LFIKKQRFEDAIVLINDFLKENPTLAILSKIELYKLLKECYRNKADYKSELHCQEEINSLEAKRDSKNQSNRVAVLRAEFKYKNIENELELKNKELELLQEKEKNTYYLISFLVAFGVLSIGSSVIIYSRQKKINLMNKKVFQAESQISESKRKQAVLEMEFKNKEITDFAIHISEKNEILEEIKNKIKELRLKDPEIQNKLTELVFFINNNITQNMEKVSLYSNIQETTTSFFQKLEFLFPDLTEKEKRVASLVRLQLSSKQIAQQLTITPKSIDNYRTSLKKKMNIPKEQSLQEFLKNLS